MDDERAASRPRMSGKAAERPARTDNDAASFDEETYLRFNPDVRQAVSNGVFKTGREHFDRYGRAEGRPFRKLGRDSRNQVVLAGYVNAIAEQPKARPCGIESLRLSGTGGIFLTGWVDDAVDPLDSVDLYFFGWAVSLDAAVLARSRRVDVESALGNVARHAYGFWGFLFAGRVLIAGQCTGVVRLKSGAETGFVLQPEIVTDHALRKLACGYLAVTKFFGRPMQAAVASIAGGIGAQLVGLNRAVVRQLVAAPYVERFGAGRQHYAASLIVCLYGRPEFLFLQCAVLARQAAMRDCELIYVCNSPQLADQVLREARLAALVYGIDLTVIIPGGNAGLAGANNLAAREARSDRLVFMHPDVLPRDAETLARHAAIVAERPAAETDLFGAALVHDNGALAQAGRYFELEATPELDGGLLRLADYGQGAPADAAAFLRPRPVLALSSAFMSVNRLWFERLDGFNEDYVFAGYEDADFCMKSLAQSRPAWLHGLSFWHTEGGSTRLRQHEGGAIVNRWLFTRNWRENLTRSLLGAEPALGGPA
jgi:GT2 family glycosyltransferase